MNYKPYIILTSLSPTQLAVLAMIGPPEDTSDRRWKEGLLFNGNGEGGGCPPPSVDVTTVERKTENVTRLLC